MSAEELGRWDFRLRALLVSEAVRSAYRELAAREPARRLGSVARVGIGYVTGANDFSTCDRALPQHSGYRPSCFACGFVPTATCRSMTWTGM